MSLERDPSQNQNRQIHICPDCSGGLVQPVGFEKIADGVWFAELECPDCDWSATRALTEADVEDYDQELDGGARVIKGEVEAIEKGELDINECIGAFATSQFGDE